MKRPLRLKCSKCRSGFELAVQGKTFVSCPNCSSLLQVPEVTQGEGTVVATTPPPSGPKIPAPKPGNHSAKFKCLSCTKAFTFEGKLDRGEYTKPPCPRCKGVRVVPLTPVAAVQVVGTLSDEQVKVIRFVKGNFKVLSELKVSLLGFEDLLKRADLPPEIERRLVRKAESLREEVLSTVESHANNRLKARLRGKGGAHGEDLL